MVSDVRHFKTIDMDTCGGCVGDGANLAVW